VTTDMFFDKIVHAGSYNFVKNEKSDCPQTRPTRYRVPLLACPAVFVHVARYFPSGMCGWIRNGVMAPYRGAPTVAVRVQPTANKGSPNARRQLRRCRPP